MSALTAFEGRPVTVMIVVEEEESVSVLFLSLKDDVSGTEDGKDGGIRIGHSERVRPLAQAM